MPESQPLPQPVEALAALIEDLENDADEYFKFGKTLNLWDGTLSVVGVLASLTATILAVYKDAYPIWVGATAAIPAATLAIQRTLTLKEKSQWYFLAATRLRGLDVTLRFTPSADPLESAKQQAVINQDLEMLWSKIGASGTAPATTRT